MGKAEKEAEGGGMRGSDAAASPSSEDRKFKKEVTVSQKTSTTIDEAALVKADANRIELLEASQRLGLDASTRAFGFALTSLKDTQDQLCKANAEIARLQLEVSKSHGKKKKVKVAKLKAEVQRYKITQRTVMVNHAITVLAPGAMHFVPKLALLADKYLPTVLAAAKSGDSTPAAAAIRLFAELNDPDPESDGAQCLEALRLMAGPKDWALIQQGLAELAASSPMATAAQAAPSYVGVGGANGSGAH